MKRSAANPTRSPVSVVPAAPEALLRELRGWILQARASVALAVDERLCALYWRIGTRVRREILKGKRAEYGARIVSAVGRELEAEFGRGFSEKSIRHMIRFAEAFPDEQIVSALRRQLSCMTGEALLASMESIMSAMNVQRINSDSFASGVSTFF